MKSVIIYESKHHGNTKKVCDRIAADHKVELVEASNVTDTFNWSEYDLIGFASGITFKKFYPSVNEAAHLIPAGKKVFFIYTCADNSQDFSANIQSIVKGKGSACIGVYGCKGFNTFGPLKFIGGMNKSNPNEDELRAASEFFEKMKTAI